jgi:terminal uridylyltransferase
VDFSVNAATPLCNNGLLAEIGRLNPRARSLALLVRRWAKDRGICHAAKGHLPPFAWTLLTIYYLQVGETPLLPPLKQLKTPASPGISIFASKDDVPSAMPEAHGAAKKSVGQLFGEFIRFYLESVDWKAEAVSVRFGRRLPPMATLPVHSLQRPDGGFETAPAIEDPFMPNQNVAQFLTAVGLQRMGEELARAKALIESSASLTTLLSPWVPPDQRPSAQAGDEDNYDEDEREAEGGWNEAERHSKTALPHLPPPGLELELNM